MEAEREEDSRTTVATLLFAALIGLMAYQIGKQNGRRGAFEWLCQQGVKQSCEVLKQHDESAEEVAEGKKGSRP